jgi:hypothetical protein
LRLLCTLTAFFCFGASSLAHNKLRSAGDLLPNTIGGQPVKFVIAEDKADPTEAAKNARKLATQDNVDALMGSVSLLTTTQVAEVAYEQKIPLLALSPVVLTFDKLDWTFVLPQRPGLMMSAVVEHMPGERSKDCRLYRVFRPMGRLHLERYRESRLERRSNSHRQTRPLCTHR